MAGDPDPVLVDGAQGEGGGQILRTALSLSLCLGRSVHIQRIRANRDRPGLRPYLLDAATTELLRTDPVQAIRSLNPQSVAQPVGTPTRSRTVISQKMAPVLRAGHDTLADGIGDEVYSARNATNEIECPVCGRWTPTVDAAQERFWCPGCDVLLRVRMAGHWAVFQTEELLALNKPRYYLPRAWNKTRSWISFQDLTEQYNTWKKIKENTP